MSATSAEQIQNSIGEDVKMKALTHSVSITSVADFVEKCRNVEPPSPFAKNYSNLCSASGGSKVLFATDDWFAAAENLLKDGPPIFVDDLD